MLIDKELQRVKNQLYGVRNIHPLSEEHLPDMIQISKKQGIDHPYAEIIVSMQDSV